MSNTKLDIVKAFKAFSDTPQGQIVLKHLLKISNFCQTTYSENTSTTMFKEGRRSLMLEILNLIQMDEKAVYDMIARFKQQEGN